MAPSMVKVIPTALSRNGRPGLSCDTASGETVSGAHRVADDQPQVLHAEPLGDQPVLRLHLVIVVAFRELRAQATTRGPR